MAKCPVCGVEDVPAAQEPCAVCVQHLKAVIDDPANLANVINGCRREYEPALGYTQLMVRTAKARRALAEQYLAVAPAERAEFLLRYNCREVLRWIYPLLGKVGAADIRRWEKE